jgi:UDP-N-acetylglucosamine--N-acetylmuramyl-(pentapeptide) pyrophosphoryl-undecaprenol N-acetylglucosamine transferase
LDLIRSHYLPVEIFCVPELAGEIGALAPDLISVTPKKELERISSLKSTPDIIALFNIPIAALDWEEIQSAQASLPKELAAHYHAMPYLHEMGAALAAADLVIARAGASTLGEFPLFQLPAVLVPYPYAWRYQKVNADYLVQRGAAIMVKDERLSNELIPTVQRLSRDPQGLQRMREAMRALARPQAAQHLANLVLELAAPRAQSRAETAGNREK